MNFEQRRALEIIGGKELVDEVERLGKEATEELERAGVSFKGLEFPEVPDAGDVVATSPVELARTLRAVVEVIGEDHGQAPDLATVADALDAEGASERLADELARVAALTSPPLSGWLKRFAELVGKLASDSAGRAVKSLAGALLASVDDSEMSRAWRDFGQADRKRSDSLRVLHKGLSQPSAVEALAAALAGGGGGAEVADLARARVAALVQDVAEKRQQLQELAATTDKQVAQLVTIQERLARVEKARLQASEKSWSRLAPQTRFMLSRMPVGGSKVKAPVRDARPPGARVIGALVQSMGGEVVADGWADAVKSGPLELGGHRFGTGRPVSDLERSLKALAKEDEKRWGNDRA